MSTKTAMVKNMTSLRKASLGIWKGRIRAMEPTTMDTTVFGYYVSGMDPVAMEHVEGVWELKCITY